MSGEGSLFDVPPAAIGRFRVLHQVGAGTSGPVFRAVHPETSAPLAIKLFTLTLTPERVSGVVSDLEALVSTIPLSEGSCELVDAGMHGSTPYLVTTFAPGDSLDVALKQFGPAALPDLIPRLRSLARSMDGAAAREVFHGALHPRDVLVSESSTLLTGLGAWPILARHGERLPTRRPYRAPELADAAITAAGDRFALAVLAYEWMTGRRAPSAFVARDMAAMPGVDTETLGRVFARALHADPGERHASCEAFVDDLEGVEVEEALVAPVPELPRAESRTRRRNRPADAAPPPTLPLEVFPAEQAEEPGVAIEPISMADPLGDHPADEHEDDLRISRPTFEGRPGPALVTSDEDEALPLATPLPASVPMSPPEPLASASVAPPLSGEDHYQPHPVPVRSSSGGMRLLSGLLLGAIVGIGAGYAVWGRNLSLPDQAAVESSDPARMAQPAAAPPTPDAANAPAGANRETPSPGAGEPPPAPAASLAAPQPPRPAPAAGNLLVRSTPAGATVFVDDERRGVTPLSLQNVDLGTRRVRILRDGFAPEERQVTLTRSRPSRSVEVRLSRATSPPRPATATRAAPTAPAATGGAPAARTGSLLIESRPTGANIVLNGRLIGTTPMTIDDLEPGTYTVQLQLATFRPITTTVRVVAGARARAAASLVSAQEPQ